MWRAWDHCERQTFIEATTNITFNEQAEIWLKACANRKKRPLEQTTLDTRRYALDKWMYPFFGDKLLANIHNAAMKEFVNHIADLSPATIRDYVNIAKSVVASARDAEGKVLFPREWDDDFLDAPEIDEQKQPTVDREEIEAILRESQEPYLTLYSLLAGCGPMRPGEALGLDIRAIHPDFRTLDIVQKAKRGELQDYMKTKNADSKHGRVVDLPVALATLLREFVGARRSGLVFCKHDGSQLMQRDILKYSLHPILKKLALEQGGLNIFRRFRITAMETAEVPQALQHTWSGHARTHVSYMVGYRRSIAILSEEKFVPYQNRMELLQGTLDLLILQTLMWGPRHGYGIAQAIRANSGELLQVDAGSLYPALHRLEKKKWIGAEWKVSENTQDVKVYKLTAAGRKRLTQERTRWEQITDAIAGVLNPAKKENQP